MSLEMRAKTTLTIPLNIKNKMTLMKFWISSCFAQITPKVLRHLGFFEIEKSSKIAILPASRRQKWRKVVHFRFARTDPRDAIYQFSLRSG